ncbi:Lipn N [Ectocarpus siliculosus]|uniref:phosphatidate phosphatase n=1 Tax=Ectocarpus siliculosus TaxID=2880 RepID=D7G275_ECTSI|nr:Lipn N [Ectocarpus siliculosus]|eukprot:CBJ48752.1 Lipn N [Ectocarpus siliculosus]
MLLYMWWKVHTTSSRERVIQLRVNGRVVPLCMKLGAAGEAFFVERVHNPLRRDLATSPLTSPLREGRIDADAPDNNGGAGGQWDEESGAQDDWESRKPKSGRRKHNARRARGRRATSDMDESCLASVASVEEAGGARMTRASTAAESSTGTPWPSSPPATAAAVMSRARSLQDHLGGGSGSGSGDEEPTAVAWAIGAEEISGSSGGEGGEGGGGVTTGAGGAPSLTQDNGPPLVSAFRGNEGGGGALAVAPSRPVPGVDAGGAGQTGYHHPPSTGGGERQDAPGVARAPLAKPSPPASSGGGVFVAAGVGTGASLSADPSAAGERGAADAAAGQPQAPSASPWIGRGGSDDGGNDDDGGGGGGGGGDSPSPPPAAAAVHPPQGVASGGGGHDDETAMRICVTDVLLETEESESSCLPQPPGEGGELRHPSLLQALAPGPAALHGVALPAAAEGGGISRAHEDEPRGTDEGRGPPSGPGVTAAAVTTTKREPEAVRVSEGDHLALAHLLLRAREDSSCLPSHREDQDKGDDPLPPATAVGAPAAGSAVGAVEARQAGAPPPSQEPGLAASAAAASLPPQGCIFPGDVESEMNQEVVAIETLSADAEAWLTGEPASGGKEMAAQRVIVASASGSSLDDKPRSRHGSNVDLKGFHTPHGGSATDLTELSPATERGAGEVGMGSLLAAVAAGADTTMARGGPDDDDGGGASREGWGQPRSPPREGGVTPPGGWSVGPRSQSGAAAGTRGGSTTPSGGRRAAAAAAAAEGGVFLGEPGQSTTGGKAGLPAAGPPRRTAPSSPPVMSLSGHLIGPEVRRGQGSGEVNKWARDAFMKEAVTWEDFSRYPQEIVQDPRLLVAVEGCLLSLSEALPHLIAASVFGNSLPQPSVARGEAPRGGSHAEASPAGGRAGGGDCDGGGGGTDGDREEAGSFCAQDGSTGGGSSSVLAQDLVGGTASRGTEAAAAAAAAGAGGAYGGGGAASDVGGVAPASDGTMAGSEEAEGAAGGYWGLSGWFSRRSGMSPPLPMGEEPGAGLASDQRLSMAGSDGRASWSRKGGGATVVAAAGGGKAAGSGRRVRRGSWRGSPSPLSIEVVGAGELKRSRGAGDVSESDEDEDLYGKTLRPTSEQLAALRLRPGCNTIEFVVNVAGQAERVVSARAFLWGSGARVVVSDIENTIARSGGGGSGRGSFSQVIGPGVHKDVSTLFSKISGNGYKILYLTNRPLPDWHAKRGAAAAAEGGVALPRGPVLCPPEVLFRGTSSKDRRSHHEVFKMTALRGLKLIFPADVNPLYGGFGNSVSDMVAYKKMAVPEGRIFLINSMGELHNINHTYRQTYLSLSRHVDLTFPPLPDDGADDSFDGHEVEDYYADNDDGDDYVDDDGDVDAEIDDAVGSGSGSGSGGGGGQDVGGSSTGVPKSVSSSSSSSVAGGGGGPGGAGDGADGPDGGGGCGGGGGVSPATGASVADTDGRDINGFVPALGGERGDGSKSKGQASRRPSLADSGSSGGGVGGIGGKEAASSKAKGAPTIPRRWEEVAPRREKSFYPNRAAVEDRFTDLNFWRDPPPLIGDDDDDDDEEEDDDESQREEDEAEKAVAAGEGEENGVAGGKDDSERED